MKISGRPASLRLAGLWIHRLLIERPIFLLATLVGATTNLNRSNQPKSEAGRPGIFSPGVGSTAINIVFGRCGVSLPRRFPVGWPLFMWKVGRSIHVTSSSIPPLVLNSNQCVGIGSPCVSLHAGGSPTLDDQPNIEWPLRKPIGGTYEAFRL